MKKFGRITLNMQNGVWQCNNWYYTAGWKNKEEVSRALIYIGATSNEYKLVMNYLNKGEL